MASAPEEERSAAARRLLGRGEGSGALDRLAGLAARLLGAASAQVSLTTDAQTVVGASGLPPGLPARRVEEPGASLCEAAARAGAPLLVTEPAAGTACSAGPAGRGGPVDPARSYLGVPLVTGAGHVVGTVCVFDPSPRAWTENDVQVLRQLAVSAVAELELAALGREYETHRIRWELASSAAGVGSFDADLRTGRLFWDDAMLALVGTTRAQFDETGASFFDRVVSDDAARVRAAIDDAVARRGAYREDVRIVRPDGQVRWVHARGQVVVGADGLPERLVGAAYDTTDVREGEAQVARTLETMSVAFFTVDVDGALRYANAGAERLLGRPRGELLGRPLGQAFAAAARPPFVGAFRDVLRTGRPVVFEAPVTPEEGEPARWYEVRAWPMPDGMSVSLLDITARRTERRRAARAAERATLLARVTAELAETLDASAATQRLARLVVPVLADWSVAALVDADGVGPVGAWHLAGPGRAELTRSAPERAAALAADPEVRRALRTGTPVRLAEVPAAGAAHDRLTPSSVLVVPLRARGRSLGLLALARGPDRPEADGDELAVAQEIALRAALSLDNALLYQGQRALAEQLQHSMLTEPSQPEGVTISVRYAPASAAAHVGGDWYDAFEQSPGRTVVVIGDVVGHDTAAAAAMGQVRALLRGVAHTTGAGPAEALSRLDSAMCSLLPGTTVTAAVLQLQHSAPTEPSQGAGGVVLRWSNAGHPPPMVVTPQGEVVVLEQAEAEADLLLGIDPTTLRRENVVRAEPGATLLLYTDGLVERRDRSISHGLEVLRSELAAVADLPLEALCDALLARLVPGSREDDVAILALRVGGG